MNNFAKGIVLVALFILMSACRNKTSKNPQSVTKIDTTVVDSEFVNLSSIVAPSLARVIERISVYLDTASSKFIQHVPRSGHVIEVVFYKHDNSDFIEIGYWPIYHEYKRIVFENNLESRSDKYQPIIRSEYMKYHFIYKKKMLAFYNLGNQSKYGNLVDTTKLLKGKPLGYLTNIEADTLINVLEWSELALKIHSNDSLELIRDELY